MKSSSVENTVVDEARQLTYVVRAPRLLTDGEMFSAIRIALLKRGGIHPARGETLVITTAGADKSGKLPLNGHCEIIPVKV